MSFIDRTSRRGRQRLQFIKVREQVRECAELWDDDSGHHEMPARFRGNLEQAEQQTNVKPFNPRGPK